MSLDIIISFFFRGAGTEKREEKAAREELNECKVGNEKRRRKVGLERRAGNRLSGVIEIRDAAVSD